MIVKVGIKTVVNWIIDTLTNLASVLGVFARNKVTHFPLENRLPIWNCELKVCFHVTMPTAWRFHTSLSASDADTLLWWIELQHSKIVLRWQERPFFMITSQINIYLYLTTTVGKFFSKFFNVLILSVNITINNQKSSKC